MVEKDRGETPISPLLVSDGKTSYRFKIKFDIERIGSREDWEKQRFEVESVAPDYIATPTSDGGPDSIVARIRRTASLGDSERESAGQD